MSNAFERFPFVTESTLSSMGVVAYISPGALRASASNCLDGVLIVRFKHDIISLVTNLPLCLKLNMEEDLDFPVPSDPLWSKVDAVRIENTNNCTLLTVVSLEHLKGSFDD